MDLPFLLLLLLLLLEVGAMVARSGAVVGTGVVSTGASVGPGVASTGASVGAGVASTGASVGGATVGTVEGMPEGLVVGTGTGRGADVFLLLEDLDDFDDLEDFRRRLGSISRASRLSLFGTALAATERFKARTARVPKERELFILC
jgi:hypothetical protein